MADDVLRHVKDGHSLAHAIVDTVREALIVLDRDLRVVYRPAMAARATPQQRLSILAAAMDWVLSLQHEEAARETLEEGKKRAQRRYGDAVLALSKAFALASASDEAAKIRDEVAFFQAVRSALTKSSPAGGKSAAERELAIQQIISCAVVSTEIVDIMKAAGIQSPDISILSDDFLAEVRQIDKKNLARCRPHRFYLRIGIFCRRIGRGFSNRTSDLRLQCRDDHGPRCPKSARLHC